MAETVYGIFPETYKIAPAEPSIKFCLWLMYNEVAKVPTQHLAFFLKLSLLPFSLTLSVQDFISKIRFQHVFFASISRELEEHSG